MPETKKKLLNAAKVVLMFALAAALVYFAFRKVEWNAFLEGLSQTRWIWVALFCIISVLALVARAIRWRELLIPFDASLTLRQIWDVNNVGNLACAVIPGSGELLRCGYVTSKKLEFDKSVGTMLCERLCDVAALVLLLIVTILLQWGRIGNFVTEKIFIPMTQPKTLLIIAAVVATIVLFIAIVFRLREKSTLCGKIADSITRIAVGITALAKCKNKMVVILSTLFIWFMYVLMSFCIIKAMPSLDSLTFADAVFFSMVGNIASVVPVPGGIGAYHYLVAAAVALLGPSRDMGLLFATLNHEIHAIVIIALGLVSYFAMVHRNDLGARSVNK